MTFNSSNEVPIEGAWEDKTQLYKFRLIEAANNVAVFELADRSSRLTCRSNSPNELSVLLEQPADQTKPAETFKFKRMK